MHDEVSPTVSEDGGDVEDPGALVLGSALASAPSKQVIWLQANSAPAMSETATQA